MSTTAQTPSTALLRSLYRSLLRELPPPSNPRKPKSSPLSNPSSLRRSIRAHLQSTIGPTPASTAATQPGRLSEFHQTITYLRSQRQYQTLIERYNPGMNMDEEERVRLSARRVGMNMPVMWEGRVQKVYQDGEGQGVRDKYERKASGEEGGGGEGEKEG